jgi:hypothetical protein
MVFTCKNFVILRWLLTDEWCIPSRRGQRGTADNVQYLRHEAKRNHTLETNPQHGWRLKHPPRKEEQFGPWEFGMSDGFSAGIHSVCGSGMCCVYFYACIYVQIYICIHIYTCMITKYVCMHICMYAYIYMYICIYIYIYILTYSMRYFTRTIEGR